ncbi:MAG: hypothetical protein ACFFBD_08725 [Candidatus Hodarchaeota archaeon]
MPFIKINAQEAVSLLEDPSVISTWLKKGKINPKEADLLESAAQKKFDELKTLCTKHFGHDGSQAFERLSKFVNSQSTVNWVLFSHTTQFIHFTEDNPLLGYIPREARVFIQETNEEIIAER